MALTVSITKPSGVTLPQSYAKVGDFRGSKSAMTFTLEYYLNKGAYDEGKPLETQQDFSCPLSVEEQSPNFVKQAYEHLKTLPEFSQATDV